MPAVETGDESFRWRRAWVYELGTDRVRQVSTASTNIWEAVWCGNEAIAAVISPAPGEGQWYSARLRLIYVNAGIGREIYAPEDQLGWPACSPSGDCLAVVEAVCSDRWIVAGNVLLIDPMSGAARRIDTREVDITYTEWRSDRHLLLADLRGLETVIGVYDVGTPGVYVVIWAGPIRTTICPESTGGLSSAALPIRAAWA